MISDWDKRWLDMAALVAQNSKDRSRKTGSVIVDKWQSVVSLGWNGFPRRVNDEVEERHLRPAKYKWTEHGERNAIYNAARRGIALEGCTIYVDWYPCADCCRGIIQSGLSEVVCPEPDWSDPIWAADFHITQEMFKEAGVSVRFVGTRNDIAK